MPEKRQFRAIKGTRDILPPDSALWNWFERTAREVFETYGFHDICLPIFEETELFARSIGADTDVVGKEMYTFRQQSVNLPSPVPFLHPPSYVRTLEEALKRNETLKGSAVESAAALLRQHAADFAHADERGDAQTTGSAYLAFVEVLVGVLRGESLTLRPEATA